MSHTPGPWQAENWNSRIIIKCLSYPNTIATVPYRTRNKDIDANARLIAAAPELLEACRKLANEAAGFLALSDPERHGTTNSRILRDRIEQARDAITKAEGQ